MEKVPEQYQPSDEEVKKAEEMMTDEQKEMSEKRETIRETDKLLLENIKKEGLPLRFDKTEVIVYLKDGSQVKGFHEGLYNMDVYLLFKNKEEIEEYYAEAYPEFTMGMLASSVETIPENERSIYVIPKETIDHIVKAKK